MKTTPPCINYKYLTFALYGKVNDERRVDLGGGRASNTVPAVCATPRRLCIPA